MHQNSSIYYSVTEDTKTDPYRTLLSFVGPAALASPAAASGILLKSFNRSLS
jgi:hypothetical protein